MKSKIVVVLCLLAMQCYSSDEVVNLSIKAQQSAPMRIFIGLIDKPGGVLEHVACTLQKDLAFEGQFDATWAYVPLERTRKEMDLLAQDRCSLALFLRFI